MSSNPTSPPDSSNEEEEEKEVGGFDGLQFAGQLLIHAAVGENGRR
jgi:hypothetical protein